MMYSLLSLNYITCSSVCIFLCMYGTVNAKCPAGFGASLNFVVEYAVWRGWHQAIILTPSNDEDCRWAVLRLVKCLGVNSVASAVNVKQKPEIISSVGIVILAPTLAGNAIETFTSTVNQINNWEMNTAAYDWLILAKSVEDFKVFAAILNKTAVRFDQNLVLALTESRQLRNINISFCVHNFKKTNRSWKNNRKLLESYAKSFYHIHPEHDWFTFYNTNKSKWEANYYRTTGVFENIARNRHYKAFGRKLPLFRSGVLNYNFSRTFKMVNITNFSLKKVVMERNHLNNIGVFFYVHIVQCFKVRINSTLYVKYLGAWNVSQSMAFVKTPYPTEARNFMGEKFIVGRCNSSQESSTSDEDGPSMSELLDDILQFLALRMNATSVTLYYSKLGFRTYEGIWTELLGALVAEAVDIILEPVTAVAPRHEYMDFIFPIADTMSNIYIRHQETSAVRDIFLAPFSLRLIACVACMGLCAAAAIMIISRTTPPLRQAGGMSCMEGIIWSIGILCQQGGSWTPRSPAASIVLIVCLFFALVIYNAYAAFITSVLSVRVASVGSVSDVLQSNLKIGYVRNGADQMYLMSTKDMQLNAFYIRGYSEAENLVSSAEEGLERAARQDYAFFSGQQVARSTLRSFSQSRGRCKLRELPVLSTRAQLAFPLRSRSPYSRPILVSLLQLRSGGVLSQLAAALAAAMPQCAPPSGFASARAADVRTALFVIMSGLLAGVLLGTGEYLWKNRSKYNRSLKKHLYRLFN